MVPALHLSASGEAYPARGADRNRWIVARRPSRREVDPHRPHGCFVETERAPDGHVLPTLTVLLANRECPWKCVMCDLWKTTLPEMVSEGAITAQVEFALALAEWSPATDASPALLSNAARRQLKLYNGGSFFDPRAIPPDEYGPIAERVCSFERVIVECHPAFVGDSCVRFQELLTRAAAARPGGRTPQLEIAIGLETAHPDALEQLNKHMTLDQFRVAASFLRSHGIDLRVFLLVHPPFVPSAEAAPWALSSIRCAFDAAATAVSLIPTRAENGAMEALAQQGLFTRPSLADLETAHAAGIALQRGRVFADLWDLEKFSTCPSCFSARRERLQQMNLTQQLGARVRCGSCAGTPTGANERGL